MAVTVGSPITGAAQTGFTSPTYTLTTDIAPDNNGKQYAVTALGGTQVGVNYHSVSSPFTITVSRPRVFKSLGKPNPTTGLVKDVPMNVYKWVGRKGMLPLAGQPYSTAIMRVELSVPAGADTASPAEIRGLISALVGAIWAQASGFGDTAVSGIL